MSEERTGPDEKYGAVEVPFVYCWKLSCVMPRDDAHDVAEAPQCEGPHGIMWAAK